MILPRVWAFNLDGAFFLKKLFIAVSYFYSS